MTYRERYLNLLRGGPIDRLPYIETAKFNMTFAYSDWMHYLKDKEEPRRRFGFDNTDVPLGFELVPVDWYAVPRYRELELPGTDGYRRIIDGRYGRVHKAIPAQPPDRPFQVRIFEDHVMKKPEDWFEVREHFRPATEGRFPEDWEAWCEKSRKADHPIVLDIRDTAAVVGNLLGEELFFYSFYEMPDLVRKMVKHLSRLVRVCAEKALREAKIDMVRLGSDFTPIIGPKVVRDFFLEAEAENVSLAKSYGIELICLQGRGNILPMINPYREIGINGILYNMETGGADLYGRLLEECGDSLFIIGAFDGRVLLESFDAIRKEVDRKIDLVRKHRILPCLHATHILPEVRFAKYRHYAEYIRSVIFGA